MGVSVALTTYNGEQYLPEQLGSILNQTRLPDELVICDDCSSDSTCEVLEEFKRRAPFKVSVIRNEVNLGYTDNFSKVLSLCSGYIVFICDQDDIWYPDKIEQVMRYFEEHESAQVVIHDLQFCDDEMNGIGETKIERVSRFTDPVTGYVTGMATAVRKPFLDLVLPVPSGYAFSFDDWIHICAIVLNVKKVMTMTLADYRRHNSAATAAKPINSNKKVSYLDFLRSSYKGDTVDVLTKRSAFHRRASQWLVVTADTLIERSICSAQDVDHAMQRMQKDVDICDGRLEVIQSALPLRVMRALIFYLKGNYSSFQGVKSMMKDMIVAGS